MTLIYTTTEAIARRLPGRLKVGGISAPFGAPAIEDGLIDQVGGQVEARVNAQLGAVYRLPLSNTQPAIASIVEKLILCELLATYSLDEEQAVSTTQGADTSYTGLMCRQGANELKDVLSGLVQLPGEVLVSGNASAIAPNITAARLRAPLTDPDRDISNIRF